MNILKFPVNFSRKSYVHTRINASALTKPLRQLEQKHDFTWQVKSMNYNGQYLTLFRYDMQKISLLRK